MLTGRFSKVLPKSSTISRIRSEYKPQVKKKPLNFFNPLKNEV